MSSVPRLLRAAWRHRGSQPALIEASGRTITAEGLLDRIDSWSAALREAGLGPGDVAGLHLSRSADQVAALFAVLDVGAAYVPLDLTYPVARLRYVLDDAEVTVIAGDRDPALDGVTPRAWVAPPPWTTRGADRPASVTAPETSPVDRHADDLAYVIYTSGSTGNPKGVRISTANLCAFLHEWDALCDPAREGRWLGLTSLSFDPSVVELVWALTRGWSVVLAPDRPVAGTVGELIERHGVTHLQCTPTRATMLLADARDRAGLAHLERVFVGGETLTAALATSLRALGPQVTNIYGPTETTVWAFAHDLPPLANPTHDLTPEPTHDPVTDPVTDPVPIGRPLPGVEAVIVDASLQPVPDGTFGQLVLGGADVADGYHRRPEQSAAAFVTLDLGRGPQRWYLTGDLAMRRPDGDVEFAGRIDDQIKILGNRIEPAEIESVLLAQPGVEQAVVAARELVAGAPRLVAYVRGAAVNETFSGRLRDACASVLPASHVPSVVVGIDAFPLTPSGKVDRRALPTPAVAAELVAGNDDELLSDVARMCELWASVLGVSVGPDDDFFALGGDSLTAVAIVAEIARVHGPSLGLSVLVDAPTPRLLMEEVRHGVGHTGTLVALRHVPNATRRLVIVHGAGGNVVNLVHAAKRLAGDLDVLAFQAHALAVPGALHDDTVEAMAQRYLEALRERQPHGPYLLCGYSDGGLVAWEMARRLLAQGETVERMILLDTAIGATEMDVSKAEQARNALRNARDRQRSVVAFARDAVVAQRAPDVALQIPDDVEARLGRTLDVQSDIELAVRRYRVAPLDVHLELIRCRHMPIAVWSDFRWDRFVRTLNVQFVSGNHLEMVWPTHAEELGQALNNALR